MPSFRGNLMVSPPATLPARLRGKTGFALTPFPPPAGLGRVKGLGEFGRLAADRQPRGGAIPQKTKPLNIFHWI